MYLTTLSLMWPVGVSGHLISDVAGIGVSDHLISDVAGIGVSDHLISDVAGRCIWPPYL